MAASKNSPKFMLPQILLTPETNSGAVMRLFSSPGKRILLCRTEFWSGTEFFGCATVNHEGCEALPRWEMMQGNAWSAKGAIHTSLGQRPRSWPEKRRRAESPTHAFALPVTGWSRAHRRSMDQAFSPGSARPPRSWAVGPGWYEAAPLALGRRGARPKGKADQTVYR